MDISQLTTFLGWCTIINFALLLFATFALTVMRDLVMRIHGSILAMSPQELMPMYVNYLACYKVLVIVFNLVPWIVLKIM